MMSVRRSIVVALCLLVTVPCAPALGAQARRPAPARHAPKPSSPKLLAAWRVTPSLPSTEQARRLTVWISDDAQKLPVRMQAQLAVGSFDLTLKGVGR